MKTLIYYLIFLGGILVFSKTIIYESDYCEGWKEGYQEGWCYQRQNCIAPIAPVCPIPLVGETTRKDGYNRGFSQGKKDRNK